MRPAGLCEHLAKEDVGAVRVEESNGVCVLRIVGRGVDVVEGILRVGLGAVLSEVVGLVVLELIGGWLQEERYGVLVAVVQLERGECVGVLGRFSSSMVSCRVGVSSLTCSM
jgi:hypothetical protein